MEIFTESGDVKAFQEFLLFRGVDDTGRVIPNALNELCRNIRKRYNPPNKGERPYTSLRRLAEEAPSEKQFLQSIGSVLFSSSSVTTRDISDAAAYFFHFASERSIEEIFAEYMAGRYRLGYEYLAQYLACSLFEKVINKKYESQQAWWSKRRQNPSTLGLDKKIEQLLPDTLRNDSIFMRREVFKDYIYKVKDSGALEIRNFSEDDDARLSEVRFRLHNFRVLRNNIIHGELEEAPDEKPNNRDEFIYYVWSELAPKIGRAHV